MTPAFPTLSAKPRIVSRKRVPNVIASDPEAGPETTRKRWTKDRWEFEVEHSPADHADQALIFDPVSGFDVQVGCRLIFTWSETEESADPVYNVRFVEPPVWDRNADLYGNSIIKYKIRST